MYIHIYEDRKTCCKNVKLVLTRLVTENPFFNLTGKNMKICAGFQVDRQLVLFFDGF